MIKWLTVPDPFVFFFPSISIFCRVLFWSFTLFNTLRLLCRFCCDFWRKTKYARAAALASRLALRQKTKRGDSCPCTLYVVEELSLLLLFFSQRFFFLFSILSVIRTKCSLSLLDQPQNRIQPPTTSIKANPDAESCLAFAPAPSPLLQEFSLISCTTNIKENVWEDTRSWAPSLPSQKESAKQQTFEDRRNARMDVVFNCRQTGGGIVKPKVGHAGGKKNLRTYPVTSPPLSVVRRAGGNFVHGG